MPHPFTIPILVPDGDPEGVRLIDRMNWTGLGIAFPCSRWMEVRQRAEFNRAGVYILVGYQEDDLPTLYIGQADGVRSRIENLVGSKTGAVLRRFGLAGAPRFLWECLNIRTVSRFPVSATSNPSCRFPAMGLPACFPSKFMRQVRPAALSGVTRDGAAGNQDRVPAARVATSYSTVSNRSHLVPGLASDVAEPSSLPSL